MTRVSCIVPAYDEAPRIGGMLRAVVGHPLVTEVIVVDDASGDGTAEAARRAGARVIALAANGGKTAALMAGIAASRGDLLLLLDADLVGLRREDVNALLAPVLSGRADAAISLRGNAPRTWRAIGLDYISGERVIARALVTGHRAALAASAPFGFEVALNQLWIAAGLRLAVVRWPGVASPPKSAKRGAWRGWLADLAMLRDILRTVPLWRAVAQIVALRRLAARPPSARILAVRPQRRQ